MGTGEFTRAKSAWPTPTPSTFARWLCPEGQHKNHQSLKNRQVNVMKKQLFIEARAIAQWIGQSSASHSVSRGPPEVLPEHRPGSNEVSPDVSKIIKQTKIIGKYFSELRFTGFKIQEALKSHSENRPY